MSKYKFYFMYKHLVNCCGQSSRVYIHYFYYHFPVRLECALVLKHSVCHLLNLNYDRNHRETNATPNQLMWQRLCFWNPGEERPALYYLVVTYLCTSAFCRIKVFAILVSLLKKRVTLLTLQMLAVVRAKLYMATCQSDEGISIALKQRVEYSCPPY